MLLLEDPGGEILARLLAGDYDEALAAALIVGAPD